MHKHDFKLPVFVNIPHLLLQVQNCVEIFEEILLCDHLSALDDEKFGYILLATKLYRFICLGTHYGQSPSKSIPETLLHALTIVIFEQIVIHLKS